MTAVLRCRLCERTQPLAPVSSCPECDGPLDVGYDLDAATVTEGRSMWRYESLLPHAPADRATPGMTPLIPAPRLSDALGVELLLKLEGANPTHSFKDRIAASAVAAAQAFGLQTLCCASTGNLGEAVAARSAAAGLEAVVLVPAEHLEVAPDRVVRCSRPRGRRHVRGLRTARERAGPAVPVGLPRRQPADARLRGREDDRLRDRRAARRHARRGRRAGRVGDALREARAGVRRGARRQVSRSASGRGCSAHRPAAARRSRPRGRTTARSRASGRRRRCARSRSATRSSASSPSAPRACRAAASTASRRTRSPTAPRSWPRRPASWPTRPAVSRSAR